LLPSLLTARRTNESLCNPQIELFEIARVYLARAGQLPAEELMVSLTSGRDLAAVRGIVEAVVAALNPAIRLEAGSAMRHESLVLHQHGEVELADPAGEPDAQLNWLSRPLSGRTLAWLVDGLILTAALLMFALIFLSIAHELPPWPLTLGTAAAAAVFVGAAYWAVFGFFGGSSLGARLAHAASNPEEREENEDAVRIR